MNIKKIIGFGLAFVLAAGTLGGCAGGSGDTLVIGYQDNGLPKLVEKSGVLKDAPYDVEWAILTGPAANLSALYSKKIDLGHMGDTSLTVEQANAQKKWTSASAPLKIVAGFRNDPDPKYPQIVTAVRTSSGIKDLSGLRGRTWAYNYGGYNHAQYLASLERAGLTEKDIKPVKFADGKTAAAAFNSGRTDVYSGAPGAILDSLRSGAAKTLQDDRDTKIPALGVWAARADVLADKQKDKNLKDFFGRLAKYFTWLDGHPAQAKQILRDVLKETPQLADFDYRQRSGGFRKLDAPLVKREQKVADVLFAGKAVKSKVDVSVEYDPRYNPAQRATESE